MKFEYLLKKRTDDCAIFKFFNFTSITFSSRQIEPFSLLHHNPCESIIYINVQLPARHTFVITSMWMHFRRGKIIKEGLTTSGNLNVLQRVIIVISKYEKQFVHRHNVITLYCYLKNHWYEKKKNQRTYNIILLILMF